MDVQLPDGTVLRGVPEGTSKADILAKLKKSGYDIAKLDSKASNAVDAMPHGLLPEFMQGMQRKIMQGATLGWGDEMSAFARALGKIGSPKTLGQRYADEKAIEDELNKRATASTGAAGTAAEVLGGLATGAGAMRGGLTLAKTGASLLSKIGRGIVEGAGYGGVQGAGSTEGNKLSGAANGALLGAGAGAAVPLVLSGARVVGAPVLSRITSAVNPQGYADRVIAQDVADSGRSVRDIVGEVTNAQAAGLDYSLADALGKTGQRRLASITKATGAPRQIATDFLEGRQAGQAERVGDILEQGLGADRTARQAGETFIDQARKSSKPLYDAIAEYPETITPRVQAMLNEDTMQQALKRGMQIQRNNVVAAGEDLAGYSVPEAHRANNAGLNAFNFKNYQAMKIGLDDMLEQYRDSFGKLNLDAYGRSLQNMRNALDEDLKQVMFKGYAAADKAYSGPASQSQAIGLGKQMAAGGRYEDNIQAFNDMNAAQQAGARIGYADRLVGNIDRSRRGVNAVGPLTSNKAQNELAAMSLFQGPTRPGDQNALLRMLDLEGRMYQTRNQALGGSSTAENLADLADTGIDPGIFASAARGDIPGAIMAGGRSVFNKMSGNTEPVRNALVERLLPLEGSEPVEVMLPRVTRESRKRARKNARIERDLVTGLTFLGSQAGGRAQ